jgi:hypothetical protein
MGLKGNRRGGLRNQEWSERGPATRFEGLATQVPRAHWTSRPHLRATLQDCRRGRLWGPPPPNIKLPRDWPLPVSRARHFVRYQHSEYEVNPRHRPGRNAAPANLASGFRGLWHLPDLRGKFADPAREIPDISDRFPVHQSREFAAKSLIVQSIQRPIRM